MKWSDFLTLSPPLYKRKNMTNNPLWSFGSWRGGGVGGSNGQGQAEAEEAAASSDSGSGKQKF